MIRLIVIILAALGIFWCWNNIDFTSIANKTADSVKNEKTVKAVANERQTNYSYEQDVINNN